MLEDSETIVIGMGYGDGIQLFALAVGDLFELSHTIHFHGVSSLQLGQCFADEWCCQSDTLETKL